MDNIEQREKEVLMTFANLELEENEKIVDKDERWEANYTLRQYVKKEAMKILNIYPKG